MAQTRFRSSSGLRLFARGLQTAQSRFPDSARIPWVDNIHRRCGRFGNSICLWRCGRGRELYAVTLLNQSTDFLRLSHPVRSVRPTCDGHHSVGAAGVVNGGRLGELCGKSGDRYGDRDERGREARGILPRISDGRSQLYPADDRARHNRRYLAACLPHRRGRASLQTTGRFAAARPSALPCGHGGTPLMNGWAGRPGFSLVRRRASREAATARRWGSPSLPVRRGYGDSWQAGGAC